MRLVKIPSSDGTYRWINADMVTEVFLGPHPEHDGYWELTLNTGELFTELTFRSKTTAMELVAKIADGKVFT